MGLPNFRHRHFVMSAKLNAYDFLLLSPQGSTNVDVSDSRQDSYRVECTLGFCQDDRVSGPDMDSNTDIWVKILLRQRLIRALARMRQ